MTTFEMFKYNPETGKCRPMGEYILGTSTYAEAYKEAAEIYPELDENDEMELIQI